MRQWFFVLNRRGEQRTGRARDPRVLEPLSHLKKLHGAFKLEFARMRLYLTKPCNRRGAAMEPKGIREIPVTVDCNQASVSGSALVTRADSHECGRDCTGRCGNPRILGGRKRVAPRIVARSPFCGNSSPARCQAPLLSLARNRRFIAPPVEHRPQRVVRAESQGPSQGNRDEDFSATDETRMKHG